MNSTMLAVIAAIMSLLALIAMARGDGQEAAGFWIASAIFWHANATKESS